MSPLRISFRCIVALLFAAPAALAASKDLGGGFVDHGVAVPISSHRGTVATVDGAGRNVLLSWLMDYRGGYELLMLDAESGKAQEFPVPFKDPNDCPYASILSSGNKFYTHYDSNFVEFDPTKPGFTFCKTTTPQMSMAMTEDDKGVIWSVTYPQSAVCSFDPKTREFHDYGSVHKENWSQYQRYAAADDTGCIYFALGMTSTQLIAFDPKTAKAQPLLSESERRRGMAYVYRDTNGKVYGQALKGQDEDWYELYRGAARKIGKHTTINAKPIITDNQGLFYTKFPNGAKVKSFNLVERTLAVEDAQGKTKQSSFDYVSEGADIMGIATAPDGTISGGTSFPMRSFSYDPKADQIINRQAYGQFNTVARQGDRFFVGGYGGGFVLEWDPSKPWVITKKNQPNCNPLFLRDCDPEIHRPSHLFATPDGKTVIMSGTPEYGYTGGGLLFWDRDAHTSVLMKHTEIVPDQSTMTFVVLPDGDLLGGTTTSPGTGGEKKANEAELYLLRMPSRKVEWHKVVFPGAQEYTDLCVAGPLVYGIADRKLYFVFDPAKREVVYQQELEPELGLSAYQQGPRAFVSGPKGEIYVLVAKGIAQVDPDSHHVTLIAKSPVSVATGGDYLDGRIYFVKHSHLFSYQLNK